MPLPPGFHTLHLGLGVRCLPLHTLLHYIDNGVLHLTETCVRKLLKDLDDNEKNEKLKFSIVTRLPEVILVISSWNLEVGMKFLSVHKIQSTEDLAVTHRGHRNSLNLQKYLGNLNFRFVHSVHSYEKQDHINVRFVEDAALKHTMMLLGLRYS
uniref:Gamma-secretase-activating protein C-terminal domain-containing protein n=1 Tax=Meleagris gallopavo TaxID=9103 RepID=A0A803XT38_MELGA